MIKLRRTRRGRRARRAEEEGLAAVPSIGRATGVELGAPAPEAHVADDLYRRHYPTVLRYCRRRLRTREEAEDAAQTTFTYALGGLQRGVVPRLEIAWLLKIALNVCLNRSDAARRRSTVEVVRDPQLLADVAPATDDADGAAADLEDALRRLPEQQRRAIVLREWHGLSYAEVASELGVSRPAVETLIFRARRSLARELGDRKLLSGLDVGSLAGALKSLLAGGGVATNVAAGAAVLATAGTIATPVVRRELHTSRPEAPAVVLPERPAPRITVAPTLSFGTTRLTSPTRPAAPPVARTANAGRPARTPSPASAAPLPTAHPPAPPPPAPQPVPAPGPDPVAPQSPPAAPAGPPAPTAQGAPSPSAPAPSPSAPAPPAAEAPGRPASTPAPPVVPPGAAPKVPPAAAPKVPPVAAPDVPPVVAPKVPPVAVPDVPAAATPDLPPVAATDLPGAPIPEVPAVATPDVPPVATPDPPALPPPAAPPVTPGVPRRP